VYQQMKEAIWGAGLVRGLTGGQKNTGAGAGEGIDSFFVILDLIRTPKYNSGTTLKNSCVVA